MRVALPTLRLRKSKWRGTSSAMGRGSGSPFGLPPLLSLARRFVDAAELTCLFPNGDNLVLRVETGELGVGERPRRDDNAGNRSRRRRVRDIEDRQHAGTVGLGAVHRDQLATRRFHQVLGRLVATNCGVIHDTVKSLRGVLSRQREMHGNLHSLVCNSSTRNLPPPMSWREQFMLVKMRRLAMPCRGHGRR